MPIEAAIPIAYLLAITLQFNLQRHFVFRHVDEFALPVRHQIGRYAIIAAVQYPTTALATAVLPGWLGVSERVVFLVVAVCMSITIFLVLRSRVFHPTAGDESLIERPVERRAQQPDPVRS